MNARRGLFRLWLIFSALFIGSVGVISYQSIEGEFYRADLARETMASITDLRNAIIAKNQQTAYCLSIHLARLRGKPIEPWEMGWPDNHLSAGTFFPVPSKDAIRDLAGSDCSVRSDAMPASHWWQAPLVSQLPKTGNYFDRFDDPIADPPSPWRRLFEVVAIALGVPLALFVVGTALLWAIAGFAKSSDSS